jgi:hypothetical protein
MKAFPAIQRLLGKHYAALHNIFRHYSALSFTSDGGASLNFTEFIQFVGDCRLIKKPALSKGRMHVIFTTCTVKLSNKASLSRSMQHVASDSANANNESKHGSSLSSSSSSSSRGSSNSLVPRQFIEAIVRLGVARYTRVKSLPERVRLLIEDDVLPNACRLHMDAFREVIGQDRIQQYLLSIRPWLHIVFSYYATLDLSQNSADKLTKMNKTEFVRLAKDCGFMRGTLTTHSLSAIFTKVLHLPSTRQTEFEMSYTEFVECLSATAMYLAPDPFQELRHKLRHFFENEVLQQLKNKSFFKHIR